MTEQNTRNTLVNLAGIAQEQLLRKRRPEVLSVNTTLSKTFDKMFEKMLVAMTRVAEKANETNQAGEFKEDDKEVTAIEREATDQGAKKIEEILALARAKTEEHYELTQGFNKSEEGVEGFYEELTIPCSFAGCKKKRRALTCLFHADIYARFLNLNDFGPLSCLNSTLVHFEEEKKTYKILRGINQVLVNQILDIRPVVNEYSGGNLMVMLREIGSEELTLGHTQKNTIGKKSVAGDNLDEIHRIHEERNLTITQSGCIISEKKTTKEKVSDKVEEALKGKLIERIATDSAFVATYEYAEGAKRLTTVQPNLQSVIRRLLKIGSGDSRMVVNKFVFLRRVKRTVVRGDDAPKVDTFLEPVYATISPKTSKEEREKQKEEAAKAKTDSADAKPPYVQFIYVSMFNGQPTIKMLSDRYINCREVLNRIVEDDAISSSLFCMDEEVKLEEEGKDDGPSLLFNVLLDRGIVAKFRYSEEKVVVEQKEYRTKYSLAHTLHNLDAIVEKETKNVRYKTLDEKSEERKTREHMFEVKRLENKGVVTQKVLERSENKVKITEEIEEPCMNAVAEWLLSRPESAQLSGLDDSCFIQPDISFIAVTLNMFETREEGTAEWVQDLEEVECKYSLIRCDFSNEEAFKSYVSVKELKDAFGKVEHDQWSSLYRVSEDGKSIEAVDKSTKEVILSAYGQGTSSLGKEVVKFPLFTPEGHLLSEVEIKTALVDKKGETKEAEPVSDEFFCRPGYSKGFEDGMITSVIQLKETPAVKLTNRLVVVSPSKVVHVAEEEPNVLSILSQRAADHSADQKLVKYSPAKDDLDKLVSKKGEKAKPRPADSGSHEADCLFHKYGLFGIKSKVTVREIEIVGGGLKSQDISRTELVKIVSSHCRNCKDSRALIMNSDSLTDGAVFTLPRQKISCLDILDAMEWFEQVTLGCDLSTKDNLLNRFKHKLQRSMNHQPKHLPEVDRKPKSKEVDVDVSVLHKTD